MPKINKLTAKQEAFCREYVVDFNATQAAIRSGYSKKTARRTGNENVQKPDVQARIKQLTDKQQEKTGVTAERVLQEVARLAFFDIRKIYDDEGNLKPIQDLDDDTAACIASVDIIEIIDEQEIKKYKTHSKTKALDSLMKRFGLDKPDEENIDQEITLNLKF